VEIELKKKLILFYFLFLPWVGFGQYFFTPPLLEPVVEQGPEIVSVAAVMVDAETGAMIYCKNPDVEIPPASLTKLMTMHLVMKAINEGRASYEDIVPITDDSWAKNFERRATVMFLEPRHIVTIRELMVGLAVSSGNDAAVALALKFAPSVPEFANMMTAEARNLGLKLTRFVEPSGLSEENMTTANEFTWFCFQYLRQHPDSIKDFHSVPYFNYPTSQNMPAGLRNNPPTVTQYNRNALLRLYPGADGLKTGYIDESGYNIALTAQRENNRFLVTLLGAPAQPGGDRIRNEDGARLLNWAFENFKTVRPVVGQIENRRLYKGKDDDIELVIAGETVFTAPVGRAEDMWAEAHINEPLIAPLPAGFRVGDLVFFDEYGELNRIPLLTARSYEKGGFFKRFWHSILLLFKK
jgi:D-alanyl-D-alanine carboxypeptidase (penicillin-binding protein 5/6)